MAEIKIYGVLTSATAEGSIIYGSQAIGSFFSVDSRENVKESIKQLGMIIFDQADQKYYKWNGTAWEETLKEVSIPDSINTVIKPILTLDPAGPGENEPAFKYIYAQDGNYHVWDGNNWVQLAKYSDITTAITAIEQKIITGIKVNNEAVTPIDGIVNIEIPAQVQPDWNATEGLGVILNKPEVYTKTEVNSALSGKQDTLTAEQLEAFTNKIDIIKLNGVAQTITDKAVDLDVLTKEDIFKVVTQTAGNTEKAVVYCIESAEDNSYTYYLYTGTEYIKLNPDKTFNAESDNAVTAKAIAGYITTKLNDINTALGTKLEKIKVNTVEATVEEKVALLKTDETSILYTLEKGFHLPQAWIDYLTRQTFAVPALTLSGFTNKNVEYGTSVKIAANTLKHRETNISNINANTLKLYKGNTSVVDLDPATSDTTIDYIFDEVITDNTITLQLKCTDTLGTERRSGTISFSSYKPVWYGALGKSVITGEDVASLTKINSASFGTVTFVSTEGQYGYFVTAGTISAVKNTEGFAAPTIKQDGTINVMLNNKTVPYNVYRIEAALAAGSNTLVVS